jgi:hypothetical protein
MTRDKALEETDRLPADLRECVHEYGLPIVTVLMKHGIRRGAVIREIVREIWAGARQTSQRRAPSSTLDWYFVQAGIDLNTPTLLRLLEDQSLIIVPKNATIQMIEASMDTVSKHDMVITKRQKHKLRLDAALEAGSKHLRRLRPAQFKGAA